MFALKQTEMLYNQIFTRNICKKREGENFIIQGAVSSVKLYCISPAHQMIHHDFTIKLYNKFKSYF